MYDARGAQIILTTHFSHRRYEPVPAENRLSLIPTKTLLEVHFSMRASALRDGEPMRIVPFLERLFICPQLDVSWYK